MTPGEYERARDHLLSNNGSALIELERKTTRQVLQGLCEYAIPIKRDFDTVMALRPFWERYAPLQRGHKPRGDALPWGAVGEKVLEGYLYMMVRDVFPGYRFPGLTYGHDVRFLSPDAFVQIDVKFTGPTDNVDEVVSSPNQVTGEGKLEANLMTNSVYVVQGERRSINFRPELAPFFILDRKLYPTVTLYVKVVYAVLEKGNQPLSYLELICVPNGLLMFDGPQWWNRRGLLIPGKDEQHVIRKRTRIRLEPLAAIADWRCIKILITDTGFRVEYRGGADATAFLKESPSPGLLKQP